MIIELYDIFQGDICEPRRYVGSPDEVLESIKRRIEESSSEIATYSTSQWAKLIRDHWPITAYWKAFLEELGQPSESSLATILVLGFNESSCSPIHVNYIKTTERTITYNELLEIYFGKGNKAAGRESLEYYNKLGLLIFK